MIEKREAAHGYTFLEAIKRLEIPGVASIPASAAERGADETEEMARLVRELHHQLVQVSTVAVSAEARAASLAGDLSQARARISELESLQTQRQVSAAPVTRASLSWPAPSTARPRVPRAGLLARLGAA